MNGVIGVVLSRQAANNATADSITINRIKHFAAKKCQNVTRLPDTAVMQPLNL